MKKKLMLIFFSILISVFSCKDSKRQIEIKKKRESMSDIAGKSNNSQLNDSLSKQVVYEFYQWYVNDIYFNRIYDYNHAQYKKYGKNKYGLNISDYRDKLNKIKYFSKEFKNILIEKNKKCNDEMLKVNWDFESEANFNISACSFLWNMEWFGSQENLDKKFEILDEFQNEDDFYKYVAQSYLNDKPLFQYDIKVIKEDGVFKINSIKRK